MILGNNKKQKIDKSDYLSRIHADENWKEKIIFNENDHHYKAYSTVLRGWVSSSDGLKSLPIKSATALLDIYFPSPNFNMMADKVFAGMTDADRNDPTHKYFGCRSPEDILEKWNEGSKKGTEMHAGFELMSNAYAYDAENDIEHEEMSPVPESVHFYEFCDELGISQGKRSFYRTEILMFNELLNISGTADTVLYDREKDGYIITDFKRVKGGLTFDPKKPKKPVSELSKDAVGQHLPAFKKLRNINSNKYGCQLAYYKRLFEHMFPGKRVIGLFLIVVDSSMIGHPDALQIHEVPLDKYEECIDQLFAQRALDILRTCGDDLPTVLTDELQEMTNTINFNP